jgi:exodeoxyribonuclease V alpha subunit
MKLQVEIQDIDRQFGQFMERLCRGKSSCIGRIASLVSAFARHGRVCLALPSVASQTISFDNGAGEISIPSLEVLTKDLREAPVVGGSGEFKPLILDKEDRLYLYRYWEYEQDLISFFRRRIDQHSPDGLINNEQATGRIALMLNRLFGENGSEINWQKFAAALCCHRTLCILTGSPGTGKTTAVGAILAVLEATARDPLRIALTAPTGKAAARLGEAIARSKKQLDYPDDIKARIPEYATTIHRLLESRPFSPYFRHDKTHLLPVDVLVIDEASMVDLPLMAKLSHALPETARLILVGDRNQLASVEAGTVYGDLCGDFAFPPFTSEFLSRMSDYVGREILSLPTISEKAGIHDCIVELRRNYRFPADGLIGRMSTAVQKGDAGSLMHVLQESSNGHIQWTNIPETHKLKEALRKTVIPEYGAYLKLVHDQADSQKIFSQFENFRILCAVRMGYFGVENINRLVEQILYEDGLISRMGGIYPGLPLIVLRNDYQLRLYNGDVGIILREGERLVACVEDENGDIRRFSPSRLPEYEKVFAMTVHKSQGSEFQKVLFMMPKQDSPLLTRELIYTAVTRAKKGLMIWSDEPVLGVAVTRVITRYSGLRDGLRASS